MEWDRQALEGSLVAEITRLLALTVHADGVVTDEEKQFVQHYFQALYPKDFADRLFAEFSRYIHDALELEDITGNIRHLLRYDEKLFLIAKLFELMAIDQIEEAEVALMESIAQQLEIHKPDFLILGDMLAPEGDFGSDVYHNLSGIKILQITDKDLGGDVILPYEGLHISIWRLKRSLFVFQHNKEQGIVLGEGLLRPRFTTRIQPEQNLWIEGSYCIDYYDLQYYFRHLNTSGVSLFLRDSPQGFQVSHQEQADSLLELQFETCRITSRSLKPDLPLRLNGKKVDSGLNLNLDDRFSYGFKTIDLRYLARHKLQEREVLSISGTPRAYSIGNQFECDILIDDNFEHAWECRLHLDDEPPLLDVHNCPYPVYVNQQIIKKSCYLAPKDVIRIRHFLIRWEADKQRYEKIDIGFQRFEAESLLFRYPKGNVGIDTVSFRVARGELVGIMGASGSGKSTLLKLLNGFFWPKSGTVWLDQYNLHNKYELLKDYLGYVPQDDLLLSNLTVYENLYYNARLRYPQGKRNLKILVNQVLRDIGLYEKRHIRVGSPLSQSLSGGERKRVNIGLELLSDSDILFLDEPTSGLSSKDSEKILHLIRQLAHSGKMVFVVIHQPSPKLYSLFHKILLLDRGGKLAYFGPGDQALDYFHSFGTPNREKNPEVRQSVDPDLLLDTLEQPLQDIDGQPLPLRKYSPSFWQKAFNDYRQSKSDLEGLTDQVEYYDLPTKPPASLGARIQVFKALFGRNFINKLRDKTNLTLTFLIPPLLGLLCGGILRYAPTADYSLYANVHLSTFLFLAVLIAVFLGMTNSVEEVIRDRSILWREKMLNLSLLSYYFSKLLTLLIFALIQNALFFCIGGALLGLKELYLWYIPFLTMVSLAGITIGLFISAIPNLSSKAAINIVPLVLVPQIIFGGALVAYDEMNRELTLFDESPIPEICQFMPSRWGFEAVMTIQGNLNRFHPEEDRMTEHFNSYRYKTSRKELFEQYFAEMGDSTAAQNRIDEERASAEEDLESFRSEYRDIYGNARIQKAISKGKTDYKKRLKLDDPYSYPMFVGEKYLPVVLVKVPTWIYNGLILAMISFLLFLVGLFMLYRRFG